MSSAAAFATDQITEGLALLHEPGGVIEIRAFNSKGHATNHYFTDAHAAASCAAKEERQGRNVYQILNVLPADLVYRDGGGTKDKEVERRRWLMVDADPVRLSDISATTEEREKARHVADEVLAYARAQGWPEPHDFDSGNGFHLLFPIDLPNDDETLALIRGVLEGLMLRFGTEDVKVDTSVHNASRVTRVYGTMNRKGKDSEPRPHRRSGLISRGSGHAGGVVGVDQLLELSVPDKPKGPTFGRNGAGGWKPFDVGAWLEENNVAVKKSGPYEGGYKWILEECPEQGHTDNSAYIIQFPGGGISAGCSHDSCKGGRGDNAWHEWRAHLQPGWPPGDYDHKDWSQEKSRADSSDSSDSFSRESYSVRTPSFPTDALPPGCARYVREAAASLRCSPELVGIPVLAALLGVMGYTAVIRIKTGWTVSGSIYAAVVDSPGSRKSPAAAMAYKPLGKLQAMLRKAHKSDLETFDKYMREHVVKKKLAAKDDLPEPDPPVRPKMRRCIVDDITVEALATRLEQNPRGFLSAHDELTGFIKGLDQYKSGGKGNARQSYLKMWWNNAIYVDRKGSEEPVVVPNPYVTLQGAIQPAVLDEIGAERDDGFLDRFIFAYPEPHKAGYSEDTISPQAELAYENVIGDLWNKQPEGEDGDELRPRVARLDPGAKELFVEAANNLAGEMHAVGFPEVLRGPWSKFDTHLARLALIIAVTRSAEEGAERERVTHADMQGALRLLDYFKATTRKVYGQLFEANSDDVLAADLVTLLTQSGYVFSGTISQLMEALESTALPDTPEALGKAVRRIVSKSPELSLDSKSTGKERIITITLAKPSEPSADDREDDAHRERVRQSW